MSENEIMSMPAAILAVTLKGSELIKEKNEDLKDQTVEIIGLNILAQEIAKMQKFISSKNLMKEYLKSDK